MVGTVFVGFFVFGVILLSPFFGVYEEELYPLFLGTGGREPVIRHLTRLSIWASHDGRNGGNTRGILGQNSRSFILFADISAS